MHNSTTNFLSHFKISVKMFMQNLPIYLRLYLQLLVADKLGKCKYVIWEYMKPESVDTIYKSSNVDKELIHIYDKYKYKLFYSLSQDCVNCLDGNNARILSQAIDSFLIKNDDLCAIGITVVIDGELSVVTGNLGMNIKRRIELLLEILYNPNFA